jgi:hypothetical protein
MDYDGNKNDLREWIDCNLYGLPYSLEKVKLISLISEVLEKLPSKDREILMHQRAVRFIAPVTRNSIAEQIFIDPISDRNSQGNLCQCSKCNELHFTLKNGTNDLMVGIWVICLSSDVLKKSKTEALYNIAHELAYVYLELPKTIDEIEEFADHDTEADKQLIKWGYKSELLKTKNYFIKKKKYIENETSLQMQC